MSAYSSIYYVICYTRTLTTCITLEPAVFWTLLRTSRYSELLGWSCFVVYGSLEFGGSQKSGYVRPSRKTAKTMS